MPNAKVNWFNSQRGYGFTSLENGTHDVSVHITDAKNSEMYGL